MKPLHSELLQLYAVVDAEVAAERPRCDASGRCCRFKEYGHTLFLSSLEAELLLEFAPPFSPPVDSAFCPFQKEILCTAREPRPLGCRIYFCDERYQQRSHEITEKCLQKLKEISDREGLPWRYAPLHVFLNESPVQNVEREATARIELTVISHLSESLVVSHTAMNLERKAETQKTENESQEVSPCDDSACSCC
jgi:hypothetical protein